MPTGFVPGKVVQRRAESDRVISERAQSRVARLTQPTPEQSRRVIVIGARRVVDGMTATLTRVARLGFDGRQADNAPTGALPVSLLKLISVGCSIALAYVAILVGV